MLKRKFVGGCRTSKSKGSPPNTPAATVAASCFVLDTLQSFAGYQAVNFMGYTMSKFCRVHRRLTSCLKAGARWCRDIDSDSPIN